MYHPVRTRRPYFTYVPFSTLWGYRIHSTPFREGKQWQTILSFVDHLVRFILFGERFLHNFQSLEIIGDIYQYTEAFCHNSWNSPELKNTKFVNIQIFGGKKQENMEDWKVARKECRKIVTKYFPIRITSLWRRIHTARPSARRKRRVPVRTQRFLWTAVLVGCLSGGL